MTAMIGFNLESGASPVNVLRSNVVRPRYLLAGTMVLLFMGGVYGIVNLILSPAAPRMKQVVHEISLLPPPPLVEQPPPPPEVKEEINIPEPQPVAQDDAPPPGDLGLDADGNGSDGFQLRARKGGRDLVGAGGPFAWYKGRIGESIDSAFYANKVRGVNYKKPVQIKLWLNPRDGGIVRFELVGSTGNLDLDKAIRNALAKVEPLGEPPPDFPQVVKLQTVLRQ